MGRLELGACRKGNDADSSRLRREYQTLAPDIPDGCSCEQTFAAYLKSGLTILGWGGDGDQRA